MRAKRKKNTRQRARTTHGYGSMKKNRGNGNKGGKGNAGSGKRSDCKKPSSWAKKRFYGKHGFTPISKKDVKTCNIECLEQSYEKLLKQGVVKEEKGLYTIDLTSIGIGKLLSKGTPSKKWSITARAASPKAVEKVKANGGDVIIGKPAAPAKKE